MNQSTILALADAIKQQRTVAYITIVEYRGSSPRREADMLIDSNGHIIAGTIGGGAIEKKAIEDALALLPSTQSKYISYKLKMSDTDPEALQMACGGNVSVLIKTYQAARRLVVVGAGHISQSLSQLADILGYRFVVIDDRPDYANAERFPTAERIIAGDVVTELSALDTDQRDAIVIVSHDHVHDIDALKIALDKPRFYLGMIGSKKKVLYSYRQLDDAGISYDASCIYAPIGLDLGGETPADIALSILAEIQKVWHGCTAEHLRHQLDNGCA